MIMLMLLKRVKGYYNMNEHYREATRVILLCLEIYGCSTVDNLNRVVFYNIGDIDKIRGIVAWLGDESYIKVATWSKKLIAWEITEKGEEFLSSL